MSRVGKNPVAVPEGVDVSVSGALLSAKGKLGEVTVPLHESVDLKIEKNVVTVAPLDQSKLACSLWGTIRSLVNNAVTGVSVGFTKKLEINGVGYRAQLKGKVLNLQLGHSHDINFPIPEGIDIKIEGDRQNIIAVSGVDKQKVGQVASKIRGFRKPEPYKGKGIKYVDEYILRKEGKKK
tara:strand:+ start:4427 stop:4966 length:540 start_codon:yes stop_codon:yes gene_type:complete